MRSLNIAPHPQFQSVSANGDFDGCLFRERQRHLEIAAARAEIDQAAVVGNRNPDTVHLCAQPANVTRLLAPVTTVGRAPVLDGSNRAGLRLRDFFAFDPDRPWS